MPFALVTIGLLVIIACVRGTQAQLAAALKADFSGSNSFFYWIAGLGAVGALGYIDALRTFSRVFLALIIVVLALHNGGFFEKFAEALANISTPPASGVDPSTGKTISDVSQAGPAPNASASASASSSAAATTAAANPVTTSAASSVMQSLGVSPLGASLLSPIIGAAGGF